MSNSYEKQSMTSPPLTIHKQLPLNGAKAKSNNSQCAITSLIFADKH